MLPESKTSNIFELTSFAPVFGLAGLYLGLFNTQYYALLYAQVTNQVVNQCAISWGFPSVHVGFVQKDKTTNKSDDVRDAFKLIDIIADVIVGPSFSSVWVPGSEHLSNEDRRRYFNMQDQLSYGCETVSQESNTMSGYFETRRKLRSKFLQYWRYLL